jgi:hypothetical protein
MNRQEPSPLPTVYADMNVYRYVAYGELSIARPERFAWVYSHVHLGEMARTGNTDALDGIKALGAVEIAEELDQSFQPTGNVFQGGYVDPHLRYRQYLEGISGYEGSIDGVVEILLRVFGADNFAELSQTPAQMQQFVDDVTNALPQPLKAELMSKAEGVFLELKDSIDRQMSNRMPIDQTRRTMGITSEKRRTAEASRSPIDEIWNVMSPAFPGLAKEQVFGLEPSSTTVGMQQTQSGAICRAHLMLNLVGLSPDGGLTKRDKIRNVISDGQHLGLASYCNAFLSADQACCAKAQMMYRYFGNRTNVLGFDYKKGYHLILEVVAGT